MWRQPQPKKARAANARDTVKRLSHQIAALVKAHAQGRPLRVGLFLRGNLELARALSHLPIRLVVMGDRFSCLYRFHRRLSRPTAQMIVLETRLSHLPVAPRSLDIVVLAHGLPSSTSPAHTLATMRELLVDNGLLVWPHPVTHGKSKPLARLFSPFRVGVSRALPRDEVCALTMTAGFRDISQTLSRGRGIFPWAITSGNAAFGWFPPY